MQFEQLRLREGGGLRNGLAGGGGGGGGVYKIASIKLWREVLVAACRAGGAVPPACHCPPACPPSAYLHSRLPPSARHNLRRLPGFRPPVWPSSSSEPAPFCQASGHLTGRHSLQNGRLPARLPPTCLAAIVSRTAAFLTAFLPAAVRPHPSPPPARLPPVCLAAIACKNAAFMSGRRRLMKPLSACSDRCRPSLGVRLPAFLSCCRRLLIPQHEEPVLITFLAH